jgi:hypothetical protein
MISEEEVVNAFEARDVRNDGRRDDFYSFMAKYPDLAIHLLPLVPVYGTWNDMFKLASQQPRLKQTIFELAAKQIEQDEKNIGSNTPLSQVGKWAPREGKALGHLAVEFAKYLVDTSSNVKHSQIMASYRKRMSRLNVALKTVEVYECSKRWNEIEPELIPIKALKVKSRAYLHENRPICRQKFIDFFNNGNTRHPESVNKARYDPVRAVFQEWQQGGWRV